jgi:hypothetical protein
LRPALIGYRDTSRCMRKTINFDRETDGGTIKIKHVFTRRMLTSELEATGPLAQFTPQQSFGK